MTFSGHVIKSLPPSRTLWGSGLCKQHLTHRSWILSGPIQVLVLDPSAGWPSVCPSVLLSPCVPAVVLEQKVKHTSCPTDAGRGGVESSRPSGGWMEPGGVLMLLRMETELLCSSRTPTPRCWTVPPSGTRRKMHASAELPWCVHVKWKRSR